ncbi:MAG: hypothetical protein KBE86_06220 [Chitinophagales bacterium]|nr:hypothetical protein [Chitinophagales bacterium]MBP9703166.1 hypothetical protein [Chitinophagales bacterium]
MKFLIPAVFLFFIQSLSAQTLNATLKNNRDSSVVAFAAIQINETNSFTTSDENGEFNFTVPEEIANIHLNISYVGCHDSILYQTAKGNHQIIYLQCDPTLLKDAVIEGLTAKDLVKKAIALIPNNYPDSSYVSAAFIRQYENVNGSFINLIEAKGWLLFTLNNRAKNNNWTEAFATENLRRSKYREIENFNEDDFSDVMFQNPVYHLQHSLLDLDGLKYFTYRYDTTSTDDNYTVLFQCNAFTTENHGVSNYTSIGLQEEGIESGKLIIDKHTFAFIRIERNAVIRNGFNYPKFNNFILPDKLYTAEFVEGNLTINYQQINGKWYLLNIMHNYTNNYFKTQTHEKTYSITKCFEYFLATPTRYINKDLFDKFNYNPELNTASYNYNADDWSINVPPYFFYPYKEVWKDLEKSMSLEEQFILNGK